MKKIDKLIFKAVVPPFLIALTVLTFIVFSIQITSIINKNAPFPAVLKISAAILPTILVFSIPLSFMIGILIGVSGLNGESQITALRACGVPVKRLLRPISLLAVFAGLSTAIFSVMVIPRTNMALRDIKDHMIVSQVPLALQPRVFNEEISNMTFYLDDLTADRKEWSRVFVADNADEKSPRTILAHSGTWMWISDKDNDQLQLHLEDGASYSVDLENPGKEQIKTFSVIDIPIELNNSNERTRNQTLKAAELGTSDLWQRALHSDSSGKTEALVEFNQRLALPFSVFSFALLGLTIAVNGRKGGRTSGFVLSLLIVLLFYVLFINGMRLASIGKINPWIGLWAADFLLISAGIFLLTRTEHSLRSDSGFILERLKRLRENSGRKYPVDRIQSRIYRFDNKFLQSIGAFFRLLFPKIFDLYISKGFLVYFFWSLITCSTLFIILTLFELLDDAIRNDIRAMKVIEYFIFYIPQILMLAVPMSILVAILINFGILEKNSEITAIKAGGWSLYRISIPIFLFAAGFSIHLFIIQDYILPYTNERQDRIWNEIKKRAPQTSIPQRKWILGESNRIYNYEYFDENKDEFVGLNVYEINFDSARLFRRIRASRAYISHDGSWILENGWVRDYRRQHDSYRSIKRESFPFPEHADYFKKEIFQPKESSKMTYNELNSHINYLMKSGYNAEGLQVELNKKISFPLSCLTMALLAIPFSFVIGKKGAFFGIGASIAIAIIYLMVSGLFETLGVHGILTPFLAAWSPNIIFAASGLWLFLSIRT